MKKLLFLAVLTLGLLGGVPAAARPANPPRVPNRPPGTEFNPDYRRHRYLFAGEVLSVGSFSLEVRGNDLHGQEKTITFVVEDDSQVPEGLDRGDRVVVDYDYTLANNVFKVVRAREVPAGQELPRPTFPEETH